MILEISLKNYRSIREKQMFSMIASGARSKSDNIFEVRLANGSSEKLTKTVGIYGANASGKSNVIRALFELQRFITKSSDYDIDNPIPAYDPFVFNTVSIDEPTEFEVIFLTKAKNKFHYKLVIDEKK